MPGYYDNNHLYMPPSAGNKNLAVAVAFKCDNQSSYAQHKYTNWLTHRRDKEVPQFSLPCGGVYRFILAWREYMAH